MKNVIRFSKLFTPAIIFSSVLITAGITSYFVMGGINMGVDFQAGHIFEIQINPTAFSVTWTGGDNANIEIKENNISISTGSEADQQYQFNFDKYTNLKSLSEAMSGIEGINIQFSEEIDLEAIKSQSLIRSTEKDSTLNEEPYLVHYYREILISEVREALSVIEGNVVIQNMGRPEDRQFLIRIEADVLEIQNEGEPIDNELSEGLSDIPLISEEAANDDEETDILVEENTVREDINIGRIINLLEDVFGEGGITILRYAYVHPRFSGTLAGQAILLMFYTLLIILAYSAVRFKPRFAIGAVAGILNDALVIIAFIVWAGMEFNTTTIAAILTILGYSINNTIVIFDRVRENRKIYPEEALENIIDRSITDTLSRTIITTLTTMIAVLSLIIFTTGSMRDFAILLQVGMISGVYTTIFIANGIVNIFEKGKIAKEKKKARVLANKISKKKPSRA